MGHRRASCNSSLLSLVVLFVWASSAQPASIAPGRVCCMTPPSPEDPCPPACNGSCQTFTNYITAGSDDCSNNGSSQCFSSGSTVIFLPGTHQVEVNASLCISSVSHLSLTSVLPNTSTSDRELSKERPIIQCISPFSIGFLFSNSTDVHIENIQFIGCGQELPGPLLTYNHTTFGFSNVSNLAISGVTVNQSSGYGVFGLNVMGNSSIIDSIFAQNSGNLWWRGGNADFFYMNCTPLMVRHPSHLSVHFSKFLYGYDHYSNPIATGLSVQVECTNVNVDINNVTLTGNVANSSEISTGGNLCLIHRNKTSAISNKLVVRNSYISEGNAYQGGGLYINVLRWAPPEGQPQAIEVINTTLEKNTARMSGGGLYIIVHEMLQSHAQACQINVTNCIFSGNSLWPMHNSGIAVFIENAFVPGFIQHRVPQFSVRLVNCSFSGSHFKISENTSNTHSGTSHSAAVFVLHNPSGVNIESCSFEGNSCSGMTALHSNVIFTGNTAFVSNTGLDGGGMVLCDRSYMYLSPNTNITFLNNTAQGRGGAIFMEDQCLETQPACFFQPDVELINTPKLLDTVHVRMTGNKARYAGSALYGGLVDYCDILAIGPNSLWSVNKTHRINGSMIFNQVFTNYSGTDLSFISSSPMGVCLCNGTEYDGTCSNRSLSVSVFPGETFSFFAVVVGQRGGTVPGTVQAKIMLSLLESEHLQRISNATECAKLSYTVFSSTVPESNVTLSLYAHEFGYNVNLASGIHYSFPQTKVSVTLKRCPLGFTITNRTDLPTCDCIHVLHDHGVTCNITRQIIQRPKYTWIGFFKHLGHSRNSTWHQGIIFQTHCPFGFCQPKAADLQVYSNETLNQDKQCAFNRTGILCGGCKAGLSAVLSSSRCLPCSNYYLFLIVVFGLAGLVLLFFLAVCNFTVVEGTINGFVFYANIVQVNYTAFFPSVPANASVVIKALAGVLSIFIAWLNLDFGIETCLYDGMDAYVKTWLQFAFPIYIWILTAVIILLCRKFAIVGRLMGTNAMKVLATLFLLSYTKLLSTIILALQSAVLTYAPVSGSPFHETVWLFDGNQRYLHGKHIFLFLTALMFGLVTLPYTLTLLCLQQLQRNSDKAVFSWVNRLKPILDAYAGPYTDRYRGWTGVMLLARLLLITAYAVNISGDVSLNLLITTSVALCILAFVRGAYKWRVLGLLEGSLILNLGLLSSATAYIQKTSGNQMAATYTLVGLAFFTFILVLFYHAVKRMSGRLTLTQPQPQIVEQVVPEARDEDTTLPDDNQQWALTVTASDNWGYERVHGTIDNAQESFDES